MSASVLETERLALRPLTLDDLDFSAAMLGDADVMRFYPKRYSREEAEGWIRRQQGRYEKSGHGLWLAVEKQTGLPVGHVGVCLQTVDGVEEPEIAYLVHRPFWRCGFASEAAIACRQYAFETLQRDHVISLIRPVNLPSQGVAKKNGMTLRRTTIFATFEHGVWRVERDAISGKSRP